MLKYAIEVQDTEGDYIQAADPTRRYTDAITALAGLTGEGTYRVRFGRQTKTEKVVAPEPSGYVVGDVIRTPRGKFDGEVVEVQDTTLVYRSVKDGVATGPVRKADQDKVTLVRRTAVAQAA